MAAATRRELVLGDFGRFKRMISRHAKIAASIKVHFSWYWGIFPVTNSATAIAPVRLGRLSVPDAMQMYRDLNIHQLGKLAFARLNEMHPEPYRTYVVDRNINYSNVCTAKCIFCNFKADPGDPTAYTLSFEQIGRKIEELISIGGTQILMQGGLVPSDADPESKGHGLPFQWYLDLLHFIRKNYPSVHIHAFSPPEIWAFSRVYEMPLRDVLLRLQDAGLATIPGGGGEILVDRVREKIAQGKSLAHEWLEVMRQAHKIGMKTSCTMVIGHIETLEDRFEHMRLLRDLQDETGGFMAFIHWTFQPEGTPLGRWKRLPPVGGEVGSGNSEFRNARLASDLSKSGLNTGTARSGVSEFLIPNSEFRRPVPDGKHLLLADGHEYLVMLAIARLFFDNIPNIQSSWVTMGPKVGQLALFYGANDMGSVMMEENVVSQAGATFRLDEDQIRRLISDAGWAPQQRDQYYRPVNTPRGNPTLSAIHHGQPLPVVPLTVAGSR